VKTTIRVNRKRPESMTKQITDQLTSLIESGAMTVGSYLPSERELANSLKVARNVVRGPCSPASRLTHNVSRQSPLLDLLLVLSLRRLGRLSLRHL